jgi:polygalacturonase
MRQVNVNDFGALGDGRHGDTDAFCAALEQVSSMPAGTALYVPQGTYRFSGRMFSLPTEPSAPFEERHQR